jgi:hypothetical protein
MACGAGAVLRSVADMHNDLSHHLARTIVDDRLRAARRSQRPAAADESPEKRVGRARQPLPLLVRARVLVARLR